MPEKKKKYTDEEIMNMSSEEFDRIYNEAPTNPEPKKKKEEKSSGGIRGYFQRRKKIMKELDNS